MRFDGSILVRQGVADADPIANPATVNTSHIALIPGRVNSSDTITTRCVLSFNGPAGETITVTFWALDDSTVRSIGGESDFSPAGVAALRFLNPTLAATLTANVLSTIAIPAGWFYARVTATTLTAGTTALVKFSAQP